ncbi:MAG: diguanylate cyclase protein [Firmicutes bacterium]|nr:diguanylate cyclase protein [Bacillota bacterium]
MLFLVFSILIFSAITLLLINKPTTEKTPQYVDGILDLSQWSFEKDGIVRLDGNWSFYFNQFLSHEDFINGVETQPVELKIPSTTSSMKSVKPFQENKFYGTLRLVIKLPENTRTLGLTSDIILTSYRLYINGLYYDEVGTVGTNKEESKACYKKIISYFDPTSNEVELIYHTSDFTAGDCTIVAPSIGLASQISNQSQIGMGRDLFLFGMLLIMGIYHFGLYFMRTKDRAPLYFGVFCILFAIRMLLVGERFLPSHLELDFIVYGKCAYISVFIGFSALCGFLYYTLEGLFAKWFIKWNVGFGILCSIFILGLPYNFLNLVLIVYAVFGFSSLFYAMLCLIKGVLKQYPYALTVFFGFAFLGVTFINDFIYQIRMTNIPSMIPLGIAIFTFTQAYTLSGRFASAFVQAELLSNENSLIMSELKLVNSNLETLVQERTKELQVTLDEMELLSKTDYLTRLPNRRSTLEWITNLIDHQKEFYIGIADLDYFKNVNDRFGHVKGDEILIRISSILKDTVANCGFVGRWGGEEFVIVLEADKIGTIHEKSEEIRTAVANYWHEDIGETITLTMGICQYNSDMDIDIIIAKADKALYEGKQMGRNRCLIAMQETAIPKALVTIYT